MMKRVVLWRKQRDAREKQLLRRCLFGEKKEMDRRQALLSLQLHYTHIQAMIHYLVFFYVILQKQQ